MTREKLLITVKTYPTLSKKYGETVCTAGIRPDGSWLRLYPVPFRRLDEKEQYRKFDWIECDVIKHKGDPRPESFRPTNPDDFIPVGHMDTSHNWNARRQLILNKSYVYTDLAELIDDAKLGTCSLAVFKPEKVVRLKVESDDRIWDPKKLQAFRDQANQPDLFEDNSWKRTFEMIPKLPYVFKYVFEDVGGRSSQMQILDWEIGALFWNCKRKYHEDSMAIKKVKEKYMDEFLTKDLHFFLGTTQEFHFRAPNPWVIIGVFPIPYEHQLELPF